MSVCVFVLRLIVGFRKKGCDAIRIQGCSWSCLCSWGYFRIRVFCW